MRESVLAITITFIISFMALTPFYSHASVYSSPQDTDRLSVEKLMDRYENKDIHGKESGGVVEDRYTYVLNRWYREGIGDSTSFEATIPPTQFNIQNWDGRLSKDAKISFDVEVEEGGLYEIGFDYRPLDDSIVPIEIAIEIDGEFQHYESRRIVLPVNWQYGESKFEIDRYGNEILPKQHKIDKWYYKVARDASNIQERPLKFYLKEGTNTITITGIGAQFMLGNVYINSPKELINYGEYISNMEDDTSSGESILLEYEAEGFSYVNSPSIKPSSLRDVSASPYDYTCERINVVDGKAWKDGGGIITWEIDVERAGYYNLAFKVRQDEKPNSPVFRNLYIDGEIPFEEVKHYPFEFSENWTNIQISAKDKVSYKFYLDEGVHTISLEVDASPMRPVIEEATRVMNEINDLSLEIKKLTGNRYDKYRDWTITDYIPDIGKRLTTWQEDLSVQYDYLKEFEDKDRDSEGATLIKLAIDQLGRLKAEPDKLPNRLNMLSEGSSSVAQYLGDLIPKMLSQPLTIDKLYIYTDGATLPSPSVDGFVKFVDSIDRFVASFKEKAYSVWGHRSEDEIHVWVNRSRFYVELLQKMADETFTEETGIEVKLSIMPDENKLILANAAGNQPDVALGISNWLPYELAARGAAADLRQFEDFGEVIAPFSPGALIPMIIEDGVYGLPETQDFWVLFYRRDILETLDIPVPDTWEDVLKILPELQRYGMNFHVPIAGSGAFKPFMATAPFIYQYGGRMYRDDGMTTAIDEEAALSGIEFMTDIFTMYSMPMQSPNFYNHFRYGTLPIGISNLTTYIQLLNAAPEIRGWWDITLYPGVIDQSGQVVRWAPGSAQSCMIFEGSKKKDAAWEFLRWWLSTPVQLEYANELQITYGEEYLWNTANREAFELLPWEEDHKQIILKQWEWLREVPKTPGSYMLEREISNIWNKVVFEGENPRSAIDDSVVDINREIARKMEEFGYMKNGKVVKPYKIPSIEMIESWVRRNDKDEE